jgi:UDP-N-acetylglucosamine/UDP-N-acetylgalactosamine diphosphorylase
MIENEVFTGCSALREVLTVEPALMEVVDRLVAHGQAEMFSRYLADATPAAVRAALSAARTVDMEQLDRHRRALKEGKHAVLRPEDVEPIEVLTVEKQAARLKADAAAGDAALAVGEIASIAFAGGAGTRFFSELKQSNNFDPGDPKGAFPITPVGGLSFFEIVIAEALDVGIRRGRLPIVLLMTSPLTHERTLQFLHRRELWGFPDEARIAFAQAYLPRLDQQGLLIVADDQGQLSLTGNGHGGVYRALEQPGPDGRTLLESLERQGIRHLIMHNIDNPAARPFTPARLGYHVREKALFTVSVVRKTDPAEKVGVLMKLRTSGRIEVVEYNMIDPQIAAERDSISGRLRHDAANINVNLIALSAVRSDLDPILYTDKVVPSRIGTVLGSSLEYLNQHITRLLPAERVCAYEVPREEFFMPTKNITGVDSVASTVSMLSAMHARRLKQCGAEIAADALCDLHPCCGDDPTFLRDRGIGPGWRLESGARLYLCAREGGRPGAPIAGEGLQVGEGGTLIIDTTRPYGEIHLQSDRRLTCDPTDAGRVSIGTGVRIEAGIRVAVHIKRGGRLIVPDGRVFDRNTEITVAENQECKL